MVDRGVVRRVQREIEAKVVSPREETAIDIVIDSPGGDAHAAYKLIVALRSRCTRLRAIVPDFAKSAATLMLLGVDEIYMSPAAELGPLDVQVEHPHREGQIVSGLDIANSLDFLGQTAINLIANGGGAVFVQTGLPRTEVLETMTTFAATFLRPAVDKLDPHLLHQASNALTIAKRYAELMLRRRNVPPDKELNQGAVDALLDQLVNHYPAHGFIISMEDARELGLPIRSAEEHPHWGAIKGFHEAFQKQSGSDVVGLVAAAGIDSIGSAASIDEASQGGSNEDPDGTAEFDEADEGPDGGASSAA